MPPSNLTKEQMGKLRELWEAGLTSVADKAKLSSAMEATGLTEKTIKVNFNLNKFVLLLYEALSGFSVPLKILM